MATTLHLRNTTTHPGAIPQNGYLDLLQVGLSVTTNLFTATTSPPAGTQEQPFVFSATQVPIRWWSERVAAQATISGPVTFIIGALRDATFTGRLRARLSKITAGGSNIETVIGQADAAADLTASAVAYTFSFTPAAPVTVVRGERFIVDMLVILVAGSYGAASSRAILQYNATTGTQNSTVGLTETLTFLPNGTKLWLRRTNASGIGTFFDLLDAIGVTAATTGVVNTQASGTKIQWTRTAGGTVLEWITGRLKAPGWTPSGLANFTGGIWLHESNTAANCFHLAEILKRTPAGGETLLFKSRDPADSELGTAATTMALSPGTFTSANVAEDDRLVLRLYIIPSISATMAGGFTCTCTYDHNVVGATGESFVKLLDGPEFKAEGDPAATSSVPGALTMGGVGN